MSHCPGCRCPQSREETRQRLWREAMQRREAVRQRRIADGKDPSHEAIVEELRASLFRTPEDVERWCETIDEDVYA